MAENPMFTHRQESGIDVEVREDLSTSIRTLPWQIPIEEWRRVRVRHLDIKRGVGRHPLIFVEVDGLRLAIKELSADVARKEIENYQRMRNKGILTLEPVGTVMRHEEPIRVDTPAGAAFEPNIVGHSITLVADRVLPDSQLYRRDFQQKNRRRILDAIIDLFVSLHLNGVWWGDASLANTLVEFTNEPIPHLGRRTTLRAILADAETVQIHRSVSDAKRMQDVEYFLDSMQWIDEDLRALGVIRGAHASAEDALYILDRYKLLFETGVRQRAFEEETGLSLNVLLGRVTRPEYVESIRRHIDEHKWYISEVRKREISTREASADWLNRVFLPVTALFRDEGVIEFLPGRTATELYVEIMVHKYYMSVQEKRDVGMVAATRDYIHRFGVKPASGTFLQKLTDGLLAILGVKERQMFFSSLG